MMIYRGRIFDEERALYGSDGAEIVNCRFDGPADGESALKESRNIKVSGTYFNLRYPFWHDKKVLVKDCEFTELCRAAFWYSEDIRIFDSRLHGIKAMRECKSVAISNSDIVSPEFGLPAFLRRTARFPADPDGIASCVDFLDVSGWLLQLRGSVVIIRAFCFHLYRHSLQ